MELSDADCVKRCLRGDTEAYRPLVLRYERLVFSHLAGRMRDSGHVEEAAQETFVRAFQNLDRLRKPESFYAWLLGIAGRVAQEHWKHQQRGVLHDTEPDELADEGSRIEDAPSLETALALLPERGRRLIELRYYQDLSCQDIARQLGMPLGTVTKTLSRAHALLRKALGPLQGNPHEERP